MDFFDIRCFLCAARNLSFSRASKEMFISQPAMSARIKTVEKELGATLFQRGTHGVQLTEEGKLAYRELGKILERFEKVKANICKMSVPDASHLVISYNGPTEWTNIHKLIQAFHAVNSQIDLSISIDRWGKQVIDLLSGRVDLIFVEKSELQNIQGIKSLFMFRDYTALAVSKSNPLAGYDSIDPEAMHEILDSCTMVIEGTRLSPKSMPVIYERLGAAGLDMRGARFVDNSEVALATASSNIAVAPIPRSFKVSNPNLHYVDIDSDKAYLDFCLAWAETNENPAIKLFSSFCQKYSW